MVREGGHYSLLPLTACLCALFCPWSFPRFLTVIGSHGCRLVVAEVGRQRRMSERGSGSDALGGNADADVKRKLEFRQCRGLPDVGYIGSCGSQGYCHVPVLLLSYLLCSFSCTFSSASAGPLRSPQYGTSSADPALFQGLLDFSKDKVMSS